MKYSTKWLIAASAAVILVGCGGTNSPLLGTGNSPRVRAINLVPASTALTVEYDSASNPVGSISAGQQTAYSTQGEGNNTVIFLNGATALTSLNQVFQFANFYTVAIYSKAGTYGTFALADNNIALDNGTSQIRVADAITTATTNVDVYVTPGASATPTLVAGNLISSASGGLAFATGTAYKHELPGTYTVTVTPTGVAGTVLLNQTVSLTGGQSITVYAQDGATSVQTTDDE